MRTIILVLALAGCTNDGEEALVGCLDDSVEAITDATVAPEGFNTSPEVAEVTLAGTVSGMLTFADDTEQALSWSVAAFTFDEVARRSWQAGPDDGSGIELAIDPADCGDVLRAKDVEVSIDSGEQLAETFTGTLQLDTEGSASFFADLALDALTGSATPFGFDPEELVNVALSLSAGHDGEAWSGELAFLGESPPDPDPDGTASATRDPYASFDLTPDAED